MKTLEPDNLIVKLHRAPIHSSPLKLSKKSNDETYNYVLDTERILYDDPISSLKKNNNTNKTPIYLEKAVPKEKLFSTHQKLR